MAERPTDIPPGARAPGYPRAPGHRVAFVPRHVRVASGGTGSDGRHRRRTASKFSTCMASSPIASA